MNVSSKPAPGRIALMQIEKGVRFGRLLIVGRGKRPEGSQDKASFWVCECECGRVTTVRRSSLLTGDTRSCGCLHIELTIARWVDGNGEGPKGRPAKLYDGRAISDWATHYGVTPEAIGARIKDHGTPHPRGMAS